MANPPIHKLATELLSHIFSFCPSSFDDFCKSPNKTNCENGPAALRVSHVSRHWRAVSHASPRLWRTITVISPRLGSGKNDFDEGRLKLHIERLKHYLKLSGQLPLRIILDDDKIKSDRFTVMERLIYPLTGERYRWESLYANLSSEYFDRASIVGQDVPPMPFLTELHLEVDHEVTSCLYAHELRTVPKLERLTIYGLVLGFFPTTHVPCFAPDSALRYLSVGGIKLDRAAPIINAASADMAVELRDIVKRDIYSYRSKEPITCSSHTLSIHTDGLDSVLVQLTLASSVKTLEFCCSEPQGEPFPLRSFKGMLSRSSSAEITNFTLRFSDISDTHLLNLLAALSCLTHLTIEEHSEARSIYHQPPLPPPFSDAFFDVLADSELDNDSYKYHPRLDRLDYFGEGKPFDVSLCPLLPRLTDLVLIFHRSSITENTVIMIESRVRPASEGIARLQSVSLHYHGDLLDEKAFLGLKKLGETEGLELDVRQLDPDSEWGYM